MIPTSPVDICNLALDAMGESTTIASIEDPQTDREELMARWYDLSRRAVLRKFVWNFAQKWTTLARTGAGEGQYADAYALPNDFVRLNLVGTDPESPVRAFEMGEGNIYASQGNSLTIRYNRDITTVGTFDPLFVRLLALEIAAATAYQVTKKKSVVDRIKEDIMEAEKKATGVDGQERPPVRVQRSRYLAARRYGGLSSGKRYDFDE